MKNKLHDYRKSYEKHQLLEGEIILDPFALFSLWLREVEASRKIEEVNTMTVSTIGIDGFPKSRVVLLKEFDEAGFTFFTNYYSEKGKAIEANSKVCISFFWPAVERQVIVKGFAEKTSNAESETYFKSRPRGSQLGAWASEQSSVISGREILEERVAALEKEYEGKDIPKPPHWGGYKVYPEQFEFWQGRPNRLHDRILFSKTGNAGWKIERLAP